MRFLEVRVYPNGDRIILRCWVKEQLPNQRIPKTISNPRCSSWHINESFDHDRFIDALEEMIKRAAQATS